MVRPIAERTAVIALDETSEQGFLDCFNNQRLPQRAYGATGRVIGYPGREQPQDNYNRDCDQYRHMLMPPNVLQRTTGCIAATVFIDQYPSGAG